MLRMAPPRRLESYKQLLKKLLALTERSAPEYSDLADANESLDRVILWDISPRKKRDGGAAKKKVGWVKTATADQADLDEVRRVQRERAERLAREADGPPPSYQPSTSDRIAAERDRTRRANQTITDEARVQRMQELELRSVMDEVVAMGYDRDLVERIQMVERHGSPVALLRSVEVQSPTSRALQTTPRFVGIANPSNYCFANATIQCLRHTPRLMEDLFAVASPNALSHRDGPSSLVEAFVLLLKRMDRGSSIRETDLARQDFLQLCGELLPAQSGEAVRLWTWYWEDDDGSFKEFGEATKEVIERGYQLGNRDVTFRLSGYTYRVVNLQAGGDGVRWQVNTSTMAERMVERRQCLRAGPAGRMVEMDWKHQKQQDAGEFVLHLLDQFSLDKNRDGSAVLGRMLTKPRTFANRGVTDSLISQLTEAAREERHREYTRICRYLRSQGGFSDR